jgi:hypothetical protein
VKRVLLAFAVLLGGCASDAPAAGPTAAPPPPAPTVDEFHSEWCGVMLPYSRMADDLFVFVRDAKIVRDLDEIVADLDTLSVSLDDASLTDAAAAVRGLTEAISPTPTGGNDARDGLEPRMN